MGALEIVNAATSVVAKAVGIGDLVGTLRVGKEADIIAANGDPVKDVLSLTDLAMVMRGGLVID